MNTKESYQEESSEFPRTCMATKPTEWHCRLENNTSEERRLQAIFAQLRLF